jgi:hypothetical protein
MRLTDREATTDYAIQRIDLCLGQDEFATALLLSSIYADIRLTSILASYFSPTEGRWKDLSRSISRVPFRAKLKLCKEFGLVRKETRRKLSDLYDMRNDVGSLPSDLSTGKPFSQRIFGPSKRNT